MLSRPTIRNLTESFESWEYRNKIRPQLRSLARAGLIQFHNQGGGRVVSLTHGGRLAAAGGFDLMQRWGRTWDGKWRLLVFDLRGKQWGLRRRLWRWLRSQRFGYLQQSVWLSPDPLDDSLLPLKHLRLTPESFTVIEGRPGGSDTDADLVRGAWDFTEINQAYAKALDQSEPAMKAAFAAKTPFAARRKWLAASRQVWLEALSADPLLPRMLWPPDYLGEEAWLNRGELLASLAKAGS
jgi:phenylacetic acid degradation operon negative regulatory protein